MHPVVRDLRPSAEQLPAVTAEGSNVVLVAGAGTGKTRTLVARYLALLAAGHSPRRLAAITFTRKAAREMRNRVRQAVDTYLATPDLAQDEILFWQQCVSELDAARIGTIHSLCSEILRAHPAEAGVDPHFAVLEETETTLLRNQAVDAALAVVAEDTEMVDLLPLYGAAGLRGILTGLIQSRLEARDALEALPDPLWPAWRALIVDHLRRFVEDTEVHAAFDDLLELRANGTLARAQNNNDTLAEPLKLLLDTWDEMRAAAADDAWLGVGSLLPRLRANLKQKGRASNWKPANPKATIKELQALHERLLPSWLRADVNPTLDRAVAQMMPELRHAFEAVVAAYEQSKGERQALDFDDLEDGALHLLRDHAAVQARWQGDLHALLVDEFQDTNERQRELVHLLCGNEAKLFIVGDARQSIYRFRGADVTVFRQERDAIAADGALFELATSYRAHRRLIEQLNALLRPVLGTTSDAARPWREPFAPLKAYRDDAFAGITAPYVELHLTVGSKADGAQERAALAVAGRIRELVTKGNSGLSYGDIAILCRASGSFEAYENAFDEIGVPYLTVAGRGFFERPEVRDLLNALRAIADPQDDLSLIGLLRSPVGGYADDELYRLRRRQFETEIPSLWDFLAQENDVGPAENLLAVVRSLHTAAGRLRTADLLHGFLGETDYRAALRQAGQFRGLRNVEKLVLTAQQSGLVEVAAFLEYVDNVRSGAVREGEASATVENAVQIMSVHQAKGLEFPIVVLGDASYAGSYHGGLIIDDDLGILPDVRDEDGSRMALYKLAAEIEKDRDDAEDDRLLYVACTRAREKLLINGCLTLKNSGQPSLRGWLAELGDTLGLTDATVDHDPHGSGSHSISLSLGDAAVACTIYDGVYAPPMKDAAPGPATGKRSQWQAPLLDPIRAVGEEELVIEELRLWTIAPVRTTTKAPAHVVGSIVHDALASWYLPDGRLDPDFLQWAVARSAELGLADRARCENAGHRARVLLDRFRSHPLYKELAAADRRLHEVPFAYSDGDRLRTGRIDVVYRHAGQWGVLEFKTDTINTQTELDALAAEHKKQLAHYVTAVERSLNLTPRASLVFLDAFASIKVITVEK